MSVDISALTKRSFQILCFLKATEAGPVTFFVIFVMLHSNFRIKMKYLKQKYYQEQAGDPCCPYSVNSTLT